MDSPLKGPNNSVNVTPPGKQPLKLPSIRDIRLNNTLNNRWAPPTPTPPPRGVLPPIEKVTFVTGGKPAPFNPPSAAEVAIKKTFAPKGAGGAATAAGGAAAVVGGGGTAGGGGGAGGAAAAAGGGGLLAPIAVGVGGFAAGVLGGGYIYNEAEDPDSPVNNALETIIDYLQEPPNTALPGSTPRSNGGATVVPPVYPFTGGQQNKRYYFLIGGSVTGEYAQKGSIVASGVGAPGGPAIMGPIGAGNIEVSTYAGNNPVGSIKWRVKINGGTVALPSNIKGVATSGWHQYIPYDGIPNCPSCYVAGFIPVDGQPDTVNPPPIQPEQKTPPQVTYNITFGGDTNIHNYPPAPTPTPNPLPPPTVIGDPTPNPTPTFSPVPDIAPFNAPAPQVTPGPGPKPQPPPFADPLEDPVFNPIGSPQTGGNTAGGAGGASGSSTGPTITTQRPPILEALLPPVPILNPLPQPQPQPSPTTNPTPTLNNQPLSERERKGIPSPIDGGGGCCVPLSAQVKKIGDKLDATDPIDLALLAVINNKLGDQVPGGLSGWLKKFGRATRLDKVINALNLLLAIHNAAMLSRNLADSIGYLIDSFLQVIGLRDEEDQPLGISAMIGGSISSFLQSILGQETYQGLSENWKKLSSIYTAAVNIYELTLNSMAGMAEGLEIIGEYTGKIGNALKKGGQVLENSYQWMDENIRVKTGRLGKVQAVVDQIQNAEEVVSNITEVTEEVRETQENVTQIKEEFKKVKDLSKMSEDDKKETEDESKDDSQSPDILDNHLFKPKPTE